MKNYQILSGFWRWALRYSFIKVYGDNLELLRNEINSETWFGAQIDSGGHALSVCRPIGEFEMISIKCALSGNKSMLDGCVKTAKVDYWNHNWVS